MKYQYKTTYLVTFLFYTTYHKRNSVLTTSLVASSEDSESETSTELDHIYSRVRSELSSLSLVFK